MSIENIENQKEDNEKAKSGFINGNKLFGDDFEELEEMEAPKKSSGKYSFLIVLIIFVLVNTFAVLLFVLDIGNLRTKLVTYKSTATDNRIMQERFDETRTELEALKKSIDEGEIAISEKEEELAEKEESLKVVQLELADREKALAERETQFASKELSTSETLFEFKDIIKIYENMEAKNAARIISALDMADKIKIIKNMKQSIASEILSEMEPSQSASIMKEIMK